MDIEQLKKQWQSLDTRTEKLQADTAAVARRIANGDIRSTQGKLARTYRANIFVAATLIPIGIFMLPDLGIGNVAVALYCIFGAIMAVVNAVMYRNISSVPLTSLPVVHAIAKAMSFARQRRLQLWVSIPAGALLTGMLLLEFLDHSETALFAGGAVGVVVGALIGWTKCRRQSRYLRTLMQELRSIGDDNPDTSPAH